MVQPPNVSLETSVSRSAAFKYCFVLFLAYRCIGAIPFLTLTSLLSFVIPHLFRTNDDPVERRKLMNNWKDREVKVFSGDDEIDVREEYVVNKRAMCLMSTTMRPLRRPIKAVLCFCHGYADNPYNLTRWAYRLLVYAGYAMVILEYEGHGRSDGLLGFIPSWDLLVDDAVTHFRNVLKKERDFRQKKCFLVGEVTALLSFDLFRRPEIVIELSFFIFAVYNSSVHGRGCLFLVLFKMSKFLGWHNFCCPHVQNK
uniref:Serine aminopeptidase S33 domain-containing protein n=1 Tax=Corethron hystrix TaxID=216773 RepID=A0A7S1B4J2_9STRA|mmetsp:Transcript_12317/g.26947  ORF Transcript_12317/g.26947 Transcript_12317/m.26947 type:complete len:255 (+) Transcript_12317:122-886(+)